MKPLLYRIDGVLSNFSGLVPIIRKVDKLLNLPKEHGDSNYGVLKLNFSLFCIGDKALSKSGSSFGVYC